MKRWALLTILLYLFCLSILVVPLFLLANPEGLEISEMLSGFYILFVPVFILIQAILLLVPVDVVRERPIRRRKIIISYVIGAVPMAALAVGFLSSILLMTWGEDAASEYLYNWTLLIFFGIFWLVWGVIFLKGFTDQNQISLTTRLTRWLLRGSILELLVAVPSHIISRQRDECCAPAFTLLGIATGLAIALLSFGPGVFFLFAQRIKNKKGKQHDKGGE